MSCSGCSTRRRLAVDHRDQARAASVEGLRDPVGLDHPAPLFAHRDDLGAAALGELDQKHPEAPALADNDAIARLDQRGDRGFQPRSPGAGDGVRECVLRLEDDARERHHLAHDRGELGIELAQERCGHRPQHSRVGHGRPGAQQDSSAGQEVPGHRGIITGRGPR